MNLELVERIVNAEMRRVDERARQILERTQALSLKRLMKLHGAARSLRQFESEKQ